MEKYTTDKQSSISNKSEDKNFKLVRAANMQPFKIEIFCSEFMDIIAEAISNTSTKYGSIDDMISDIKKPITMKIDGEVYKRLCDMGEKSDIELVCKYVAVQRILTCSQNKPFVGMIEKARESIRNIPINTRHVLTGDKYNKIFAIIPAAYLSSVCNLSGVSSEVSKMDKSHARTMKSIMDELSTMTVCEDGELGEAYSAISDLVDRTLNAYKDHNIIDLRNVQKELKEMFDGELGEYFEKLMILIDKDISDNFTKFAEMVRSVKESDEAELSQDTPDPMEFDPVPQEELDQAMGVEPPDDHDYENDSVVNGLSDQQQDQGGEAPIDLTSGGDSTPDQNQQPQQQNPQQPAGGVVTGLESVMMNESIFRKKLKRISRECIGYVKVRGMNARDADELTMIVSYGYSIAEKCEWYMDIIQREDNRYVVPQTYAELESIKDQMYKVLDDLMKDPIFRQRGSIFKTTGIEI